jgi:branched-subunit amino acid ABC-type transport system permease component
MKQSPFGLTFAAILYGAISLTANAVGAEDLSVAGLRSQELSTADRADLKALRSGDMLKLVVSNQAAETAAPALSAMMIYILMATVLVFKPRGLFPPAGSNR